MCVLLLSQVFNSCLRLNHFPRSWKQAKIIMSLMPGKQHVYGRSYRTVSLLPAISKVFKRLLYVRIASLLGQQQAIRPQLPPNYLMLKTKSVHRSRPLGGQSKTFEQVWQEVSSVNWHIYLASTVRLFWPYLLGWMSYISVYSMDSIYSCKRVCVQIFVESLLPN